MAQAKVIYIGLFLTDAGKMKLLANVPLKHDNVHADHLTLAFKPDETTLKNFESMRGRRQEMRIVGYVQDEKGEAVLIERASLMFECRNEFPHVTLSCAESVSPVYSNDLVKQLGAVGCSIVAEPDRSSCGPFEAFTVEAVFDTYPRTVLK